MAVMGLAPACLVPATAGADGFTSFDVRATAEGVRFSVGAPCGARRP